MDPGASSFVPKCELFRRIVRVEKYPIEVRRKAVLAGARLTLAASPVVLTSLSPAKTVHEHPASPDSHGAGPSKTHTGMGNQRGTAEPDKRQRVIPEFVHLWTSRAVIHFFIGVE